MRRILDLSMGPLSLRCYWVLFFGTRIPANFSVGMLFYRPRCYFFGAFLRLKEMPATNRNWLITQRDMKPPRNNNPYENRRFSERMLFRAHILENRAPKYGRRCIWGWCLFYVMAGNVTHRHKGDRRAESPGGGIRPHLENPHSERGEMVELFQKASNSISKYVLKKEIMRRTGGKRDVIFLPSGGVSPVRGRWIGGWLRSGLSRRLWLLSVAVVSYWSVCGPM